MSNKAFKRHYLQVISEYPKEWRPYWVDYAGLKLAIRDTVRETKAIRESHIEKPSEKPVLLDINDFVSEQYFFRKMKNQVMLVSDFYSRTMELCTQQMSAFQYGEAQLEVPRTDEEMQSRLKQILEIQAMLVNLQNYCNLSSEALVRILVKHDTESYFKNLSQFVSSLLVPSLFWEHQLLNEMFLSTIAAGKRYKAQLQRSRMSMDSLSLSPGEKETMPTDHSIISPKPTQIGTGVALTSAVGQSSMTTFQFDDPSMFGTEGSRMSAISEYWSSATNPGESQMDVCEEDDCYDEDDFGEEDSWPAISTGHKREFDPTEFQDDISEEPKSKTRKSED